jgi:YHS domain-containing protein
MGVIFWEFLHAREIAMGSFTQAVRFGVITLMTMGVGTAVAFDPSSPASVNVDTSGVGLKGHDPVAYFTAAAPTAGSREITAEHEGVTYSFVSAENRDAFLADPARYVPAYGGFCAMAMSLGLKVDIDPNAWKIVDNRLYVQANPQAASFWEQDIPGNISKAEGFWPEVKDKAPAELQPPAE